MSDSILKFANKLEIRYSFNNKSNYMDAMTKHRCEKEILTLIRSLADMLKYNCKKVSRAKLQEGDLVFFKTGRGGKRGVPNHVGIYLKNGRFIHTSTSSGVMVSSLSEPYYTRTWLTGGRVK